MTALQRLMRDVLRDDAGTPLSPACRAARPARRRPVALRRAVVAAAPRSLLVLRRAWRVSHGDHVDPRSRGARGVGTIHGWISTAGACERCNGAKRDLGLLVFPPSPALERHQRPPGEPARATRRVVRWWPDDVTTDVRSGGRVAARAGTEPLRPDALIRLQVGMLGVCPCRLAWRVLSEAEREQLEVWTRWRTSAQALAQRSRIVLLAAENLKNTRSRSGSESARRW
jgi:hypothetical protein